MSTAVDVLPEAKHMAATSFQTLHSVHATLQQHFLVIQFLSDQKMSTAVDKWPKNDRQSKSRSQ